MFTNNLQVFDTKVMKGENVCDLENASIVVRQYNYSFKKIEK